MIKAEVGDTILVTFFNKASWPFSIQPHGVSYGKAWEGMRYHDGLWLTFFYLIVLGLSGMELNFPAAAHIVLCSALAARP